MRGTLSFRHVSSYSGIQRIRNAFIVVVNIIKFQWYGNVGLKIAADSPERSCWGRADRDRKRDHITLSVLQLPAYQLLCVCVWRGGGGCASARKTTLITRFLRGGGVSALPPPETTAAVNMQVLEWILFLFCLFLNTHHKYYSFIQTEACTTTESRV